MAKSYVLSKENPQAGWAGAGTQAARVHYLGTTLTVPECLVAMPQARVQEALGRRFYPGPRAGPLLHQGSITSHPANANLVSSGGRWRRCGICVARQADRQDEMCRARAEWRFGPWETWNCCMAAWPALVWLGLPLHCRDARPDP